MRQIYSQAEANELALTPLTLWISIDNRQPRVFTWIEPTDIRNFRPIIITQWEYICYYNLHLYSEADGDTKEDLDKGIEEHEFFWYRRIPRRTIPRKYRSVKQTYLSGTERYYNSLQPLKYNPSTKTYD